MHIFTIARYTALEALRTRVPATALLALLLLLAASFFVRELAVTESTRFQITFYATAARLCAVFMTALVVLSSITREFNDKGLEVVLALDLPRAHYIFGKLAGFAATALLIALILATPLLMLASPVSAVLWTCSLAIELALVVALALFCIITFNQILPAAAFVAAFYLLARSMTAMRLMSAQPISGQDTLSQQFTSLLTESLAYVIPALDQWTATAWLVDAAPEPALLAAIGLQGMLYVALLAGAALFDFYRRNF